MNKLLLFSKLAFYDQFYECPIDDIIVFINCTMKASLTNFFEVGDKFEQISVSFSDLFGPKVISFETSSGYLIFELPTEIIEVEFN